MDEGLREAVRLLQRLGFVILSVDAETLRVTVELPGVRE